jgi:quinol monooxygenase YgiN
MAVRLVIQTRAAEGKGSDLAKLYPPRLLEVQQEPGCEQYEVFQSVLDPDKFVLLERWSDAEALAVHSKLNQTRPPVAPPELRSGIPGEREDYEYKRTR